MPRRRVNDAWLETMHKTEGVFFSDQHVEDARH